MLNKLLLYLYRLLSAVVVVVGASFSLYFLATAPWTKKLGQAWYEANVGSLNLFQVITERYLHLNIVWDHVIVPWLNMPIWGAVLVLIAVMAIILWLLRLLFAEVM